MCAACGPIDHHGPMYESTSSGRMVRSSAATNSLPRPFSTLFFGSAMCEMTDMATANDVTGVAGCIQMAWELKTRLACHVMAFDESNTIEQYLIRDDSHVTDAL